MFTIKLINNKSLFIFFILNFLFSNDTTFFKNLVSIKVDGQTIFIDNLNREPVSGDILIKTKLGIKKKGELKNGIIDGTWIEYYNDGYIFKKGFYKDGVLNDWQYVYATVGFHFFGVQESVLVDKCYYLDGVESGPCSSWTKNGALITTYDVKNGSRINIIDHFKKD